MMDKTTLILWLKRVLATFEAIRDNLDYELEDKLKPEYADRLTYRRIIPEHVSEQVQFYVPDGRALGWQRGDPIPEGYKLYEEEHHLLALDQLVEAIKRFEQEIEKLEGKSSNV